jgi:hypothetical protein
MSFEISAIKSIAANRSLTKRGSNLFDRKRLTDERAGPVAYRAPFRPGRKHEDTKVYFKPETLVLLAISLLLVAGIFWYLGALLGM